MAERIAYLEAVVGADITSFRRGMQDVRRETGILSDTIGGLGHLGRTMTLAVSAPLAALGAGAVRVASDFDATMRKINSIMFLPEAQLADLSERVLSFGSSIRSGPLAAAEALNTVFQAGLTDVETAFMVMRIGAQTAEAGLADLTSTTEGLVAAALTFGDQSETALKRFSDAITLSVQLGVGSMDEFNTAFANVMGSSAAVGQSFDEMAGVVAFLTQRGIQAGAAGTYLNNALTKLIKPTEAMTSMFEKLGVKSGKELIKTFGGLVPALRAIYKEIGDNEAVWAQLFNDVRGFRAVSRIFTAFEKDGTDAVSAFFDEFLGKVEAGGITTAAWEQQMMSFEAQLALFNSALQGVGITIGSILLPILTPIINGFTDFLRGLMEINPNLLKLGVAFGIAALAAGPLLWIIGSMISPIGLLMGAVGLLATVWATNWGNIRDTVTGIFNEIKGPIDEIRGAINDFVNDLFGQPVNSEAGAPEAAEGEKTVERRKVQVPIEFELLPRYDPKFKSIYDIAKENNVTVDDVLKALGVQTLTEAMSVRPGKYTLMAEVEMDVEVENAWSGVVTDLENQASSGPNSFGERLSNALSRAWERIKPALSQIWDKVKAWILDVGIPSLDSLAGDGLDGIARIFSGTKNEAGDTPLYEALRSIFNADIGKAVSDIGTFFTDNFPQVRTGLETLAGNIGTWLQDEGVPTIARGIGYFAGTLVSLVASAIPAAFQTLVGAASDVVGGAGDAVGKVGEFVGDSILEPMRAGIQQAIGDRGVGGGDAIVTSFATQIALLFAGNKLVSALTGLDVGGTIIRAIWKAIAGAAAAAPATSAAASAAAGIGAALKGSLETLILQGMYFSDFVAALGAKILGGLVGVLTSPITLGITLGTLLYIAIPSSWKDAIHNVFANLIDAAFGEGATDTLLKNVERAGYQAIGLWADLTGDEALRHAANVSLGIDDSPEAIDRAKQFAQEYSAAFKFHLEQSMLALGSDTGVISLGPSVLDEIWGRAVQEFTTNPSARLDMPAFVAGMIASSEVSSLPAQEQEAFRRALTDALNKLAEGIAVTPGVEVATPVVKTPEASEAITWSQVLDQILPKPEDGVEVKPTAPIPVAVDDMIVYTPESAQASVNGMAQVVNEAVSAAVAAGNFDGAPIADSLVTPIDTAFINAFGEAGTTRLAWAGFVEAFVLKVADVVGGFSDIQDKIIKLKEAAALNFPLIQDAAVKALAAIIDKLNVVNSALQTMTSKIQTAANNMGAPGTASPVPARASGGSLWPGLTLVGERGPELIMAGNRGMVMSTRMLRDLSGGGVTNNQVNIYGVQDVDGLLFELERRGINLNGH